MDLHSLGVKYKTDKAPANFLKFYDQFFTPLRNEKINFLEIGVLGGASINMWHEYFSNAMIDCADRNVEFFKNVPEGIRCFQLDQKDETSLSTFQKSIGKAYYDIILDDGNHTVFSNLLTFKHLWPLVKSGGMFVIEDVHTSLDPENYNIENCSKTTFDLANALNKRIDFSSETTNQVIMDLKSYKVILNEVASVELYRGMMKELDIGRIETYTFLIKKI